MHIEMAARNQFDDEESRVAASLTERMLTYQDVLHGAEGLYSASRSVERWEWRAYLENIGMRKRFPGIDGMGFVESVMREDLERFVKQRRQDDSPTFEVKSPGEEDLMVVKYMEPEERHGSLLGMDLGTDAETRSVAERARDTGLATISSGMNLREEGTRPQKGFIMLLPVYRRGAPTSTTPERQENLEGWIYARFITAQLMRGLMENKSPTVELEVFDGLQPSAENLIFSENTDWDAAHPKYRPRFSDASPLRLAGHAWTLQFKTNPAFDAAMPQSYSFAIGTGGALISLLLFGIVWSLSRTREQALAIASEMTAALRRTNEQLEHERFLLRTLMDNLPDRIYFKDTGSRFLRNSRAHLKRFGLKKSEEAAGKTDFDFFSEEHAREAFTDEQDLMRTGQPLTKEERETWPDGKVTWALTTKMPLRDEKGNIIGTFGISHDITDRIHAEEALRHAKEAAEEASRIKSQFLANVSHELRTPLNSVIGFTGLLLKNKLGNLTKEDLNFLERVQVNGRHLLALINDMLDVSKIEAQKVELQLGPVNLGSLIRETVAQQESLLGDRPIRFVAEVPAEVAPIRTDAEKLRQVIINLIGNALKFTEQGSVTVRVRTETDHQPSRIEVVDTGIGIPREKLGLIFEAFQQADASTARKYGGTGLGLTISQALCRLMGFRIEVASEVGRGSTFSIVLSPSTDVARDGNIDGSGKQLGLPLHRESSPKQAA
jgi:PAS domain S-box-containing protein